MDTQVKLIDVNPTYEQSVPSLVLSLSHGSDQVRQAAYEEFIRMAKLADRHMAFLNAEVH